MFFNVFLFCLKGCRETLRENGFHRTENASPPCRLEDSFKKTFPLDGKKLSLEGVSKKSEKIGSNSWKISFHKQELPPPNFKNFSKALNKKYFFH